MPEDLNVIPPGLKGNLVHYISGGEEGSLWKEYTNVRYYTNAFVVQGQKILLGHKKRGWGQEKYNGFGGKVDAGETSLEAAKRELKEEAGIDAPLEHAGILLFLTDGVDWAFHIDIYRADSYSGEVQESEEMKPEWFSTLPEGTDGLSSIPYSKMWETDECWLPLVIANKPFVGRADFVGDKDKSKPYKWWYGVLKDEEAFDV
ncbi:hypothetical protein FA15DRAFT_633793 [Coprinopsis marcescibilis]|uniref:Oxidized purine nucleoside triphosphate hydrolase n=1 Tax=Coprinopsis marcescibilis TaxID=230819 RepID=A0A5C3L677_COPMA|nr:hypothetical protein FA15DRAFT_633793 [Coprinopsis marcescibilis]